MSFRDRVVESVSSLLENLAEGDELSGVDPLALDKELSRRKAAREKAGNPSPLDNRRARLAQAGPEARAKRASMAAKRLSAIHARRAKQAASKKREQDAAFRHMAEEARRNPPPRSSASSSSSQYRGSGPSSQSRGSRSSSRPSIFQKKDLAAHFKTLDVEYGADAATVKKAYRGLMRKYHPDLHRDPKKKKAATELTVKISAAYAAIEKSRKK